MGKEWYWTGRSSKTQTQTTPSSGCMCAFFHFFDFHPFHFPTLNQQQQQQTNFNSASCFTEEDHTTIPKGAEAPRNSLESEDGTASSVLKEENLTIKKNILQIKTSGGNLNDLSSIDSPGTTKTPTLVARLMGLDLLPDDSTQSPSSSSSSSHSIPNPQTNNIPHHHLRHPRQHILITKPRNSTDSDIATSTRSLPDTPRISSARRSDVDHHRFSLQINNKENIMGLVHEDLLELPRFSFSKMKYDENNSIRSSPSHYARQIVKQIKESVSRKVGQDITNTLKSREECSGKFRTNKTKSPKTSSSLKVPDESSIGKQFSSSSSSSISPRLKFMDTKHKSNTTTSSPLTSKDQNTTHTNGVKLSPPTPSLLVNTTQPQLPRVLTKPIKPQALTGKQDNLQKPTVPRSKNKTTSEKFSSRLKNPLQTSSDIIRNKQEESFVIRPTSPTRPSDIKKTTTKSKKTLSLSSSNLLNNINSTVPNLLPLKTDPSPPATKVPQKQVVSDTKESKRSSQLSSCSSQRYKQEGITSTLATRESSNNSEDKAHYAYSTATGAEVVHTPEFQYIKGILSRTSSGVLYKETTSTSNNTTITSTVSLNQWFSPTHPLDPSIFHHLEEHPTSSFNSFAPNNDKDCIFTPKNQLGHRWNRRLLFDLVDEVLVEFLRPRSNEKRLWFLHGCCYQGSMEELMESVWKRIGKFPCAKCEVLEDIDGLIETEDMEKVKVEGEEALEEEREGLVTEIEGNLFDTLVHETVMLCGKWGL